LQPASAPLCRTTKLGQVIAAPHNNLIRSDVLVPNKVPCFPEVLCVEHLAVSQCGMATSDDDVALLDEQLIVH